MVEDHDLSGLGSILADDAVFHSPIVHTPQVGKARVQPYLTAAFHVFLNPTFKYVREIVSESDAVLEFVVEIDGIQVNGVDMLNFDEAGLISEFKVMIRPLKAVNIIHEKMGEMLAAHAQRNK
ncbi:MAG: nuclear transport factor 2 family protein [Acidobacteria bacterium]|nr:nuclear transport factor 2 family protein [Acidobacteriota bacterium]